MNINDMNEIIKVAESRGARSERLRILSILNEELKSFVKKEPITQINYEIAEYIGSLFDKI